MTDNFTTRVTKILIIVTAIAVPTVANAGLIFTFKDDGNNLTMTTSGTLDTRKLILLETFSNWSNDGFGNFGNYSFIGDGNHGLFDRSFGFSDGTDYSQWHVSANIFSNMQFDPNLNSGSQSFSTLNFPAPYTPGFNAKSEDIINGIWTPDATWTFFNTSIDSLGLTQGSYTVRDARSGEFIRYQIGAITVPEPSALTLFGLVLLSLLSSRKQKSKKIFTGPTIAFNYFDKTHKRMQ